MNATAATGPLLLVLETATPVASVALFEGERLLGHADYRVKASHARLLMPTVAQLLENLEKTTNDLSAICVSGGPGSYTGLRVGTSTAKGLAMAGNIPIMALGTLELLAWQMEAVAAHLSARVIPLLDARRMEVYAQIFDSQVKALSQPEAIILEEDSFAAHLEAGPVIFVGDGALKTQPLLENHPNAYFFSETVPTTAAAGKAVFQKYQRQEFVDLVDFEPFYLKSVRITKSKKRLPGR